MVGGGIGTFDPTVANRLFPKLATLQSAAHSMERGLSNLIGKVEGLYIDVTPTSFRIGAANELANNDQVSLEQLILRGGWHLNGDCKVWEYLLPTISSLNVSGRGITGWPNPKRRCYPPR